MKLNYKSIRGVAKNVCTAEQKIAYNIAFRLHISFQDEFDKLPAGLPRFQAAVKMVDEGLRRFTSAWDYKPGQYNLEAIQAALDGGLQDYLESKRWVLGSYEEIGRIFPAFM